jgi:hypothetical protein
MIWYFIEGYYNRKNEQNFRSNDFMKYTVSMPVEPETITFYKSKFSEKWWMEVPYASGRERYSRNSIVPAATTTIKQPHVARFRSVLLRRSRNSCKIFFVVWRCIYR